jgi:hypothetical protein
MLEFGFHGSLRFGQSNTPPCPAAQRVSVFKPYTSRPANSERYILCVGLKERSPRVVDYLLDINDAMNKLGDWWRDDEDDIVDVWHPSSSCAAPPIYWS